MPTEKPRVLHVIARYNIGGTARYLNNLFSKISSEAEMLLAVGHVQGYEIEDSSLEYVNFERIEHLGRKINPISDLRAYLELRRLVKSYKPQIIHSHTFKAGLLSRLMFFRIPKVHTFHGHLMGDPEFSRRALQVIINIERRLAKLTKRIITVGEQVTTDLISVGVGKPTQYIVGSAPFRYLEYEVGPGVLIPRPETESLVDEVLHQLNTFADPVSLVDLGSGTGAIAISIASETAGKKVVHVVAVEKSTEAIVWLQKNITKHDVSVRVIDEDVATALTGIKCDVVVANPPYLPDGAQIPQELNFEPTQALFGGPANGMAAPLIFIAAAARLLKPGGLLAIEHNELQGALIANELAQDFENIALHSDLTDRPRFTTARRKF